MDETTHKLIGLTSGLQLAVAEYRRSMADAAADPGWEQARAKFEQLTAELLDASARARLIAVVDSLERQDGVDELLALTRLRSCG